MRRVHILLSSLCLSPFLVFSLEGQQHSSSEEQADCGCGPRPQRVEVKHIEGKGIGYSKGYTTLEGFFTVPSTLDNDWVPFFDIRGHVFNDGRPAVNAGLGVRYLGSRVWGANIYYDYRKTSRTHYNQIGAGLETLGEIWDFRINGYFPVGHKVSHSYHFKFDKFQGNRVILKSKREFAMTGVNAEVGAHAYERENLDLYAAAGPYYFAGQGHSAWGGEGRLVLTAVDHIRVQLSGSYDSVFKGIVQGEIGVFFSWGGRRMIKKRECMDCCDSRMIVNRALQRVDRQEIIVVDHKHKHSAAINPVTGDPYTVWFVNNLSSSLGTFESPFPTLLQAQNASGPNDIIYVYAGDGTDTGMNGGIILKNGQQFLGAGINQSLNTTHGTISIPAQASGLPLVSNLTDPTGFGVQLKDGNNIVSGFNLQDKIGNAVGSFFSGALSIIGGSDYLIKQNTISTFSFGDGINIYGGGNNTVIENNTIQSRIPVGDAFGIFIVQGPALPHLEGKVTIQNNLFNAVDSSSSLTEGIDYEGGGLTPVSGLPDFTLIVANNTFQMSPFTFRHGMQIQNAMGGPATLTATINNNQIFLSDSAVNIGVNVVESAGSGPMVISLDGNLVQPSPLPTGYRFVNLTGDPAKLQVNFGSNVGTRIGP